MNEVKRVLHGRRVIYTDESVITEENLFKVLEEVLQVHNTNQSDIDYLYKYYKGRQPILDRAESKARPDVAVSRIVENRANEIVTFKVGYLLGEPIQYVNRRGEDAVTDAITKLNEYVFAEDKASEDVELCKWFTICGTSYRMVYPDRLAGDDEDEAPFEIFTLDPRYCFVVYSSDLGHKPMMAVKMVKDQKKVRFYVYTDTYHWVIEASVGYTDYSIIKRETHYLGCVPIIEYPANPERMGAFEAVLPLLDSINEVESNRCDAINIFIQALLLLKGVDADDEDIARIRETGAVMVPSDGDVKYLIQELNQSETQTLIDHMYSTVLTICGMPNENIGSSDTGSAVILRNGWQSAESRAKETELIFKKSEKKMLKLLLNIVNSIRGINLKLADVEIRFTRRNYENIQEKAQVLLMMLNSDKIHPKLAFEQSGMFIDPETAYLMSIEYNEEQEAKLAKELEQFATDGENKNQNDQPVEEEDDV